MVDKFSKTYSIFNKISTVEFLKLLNLKKASVREFSRYTYTLFEKHDRKYFFQVTPCIIKFNNSLPIIYNKNKLSEIFFISNGMV